MNRPPYTAASIRESVERDRVRLFSDYSKDRLPGWSCDQATKDLMSTMKWVREELFRLAVSEDDRRSAEHLYNRWTRGDPDVFAVAAEVLNIAREGRVSEFGRHGEREHRGW